MNRRCRVSLLISACVVGVGATVCIGEDEPSPDTPAGLPKAIVDLPQFGGKNPPTPLSTKQERDVFDAVFERFADIERIETLAFIRQHYPRELQEFTRLSRRDLLKSMEYFVDVVDRALELMEIRDNNPDVYNIMIRHRELEEHVKALAKELRAAEGIDLTNAVATLHETLQESFSAKQKLMQIDIEQMDRQLNALREMLKDRETNSDLIIRRRYDEIVGDTARLNLKW